MSRQGRINHWLSTNLDGPSRFFGRLHARLGWPRKLFGAPVFRLTVRGRKSGEDRAVMLILARRGPDDLVVCGSNGGNPRPPAWWLNLLAAGEAEAQVHDEVWHVRARVVEGAERDECWRVLCDAYPDFETYQERCDRQLPVAVLTRTGPTAS